MGWSGWSHGPPAVISSTPPAASLPPVKRHVVRYVDDRERPPRSAGAVRSGVVEGAAVVEGDAAGGHLHGDRLGHREPLRLHPVDDALPRHRERDRFLAAVAVRSRHEVQAAVVHGDVVHGDPGRERAHRIHAPIRSVLVPVGRPAALTRRLDHGVVVVDAHVAAPRKAPSGLGQIGMEREGLRGRMVRPQVDHLVEHPLVVFRNPPTAFRTPDALAVPCDRAVDRVAQLVHLVRGKEPLVADVALLLEERDVPLGHPAQCTRHVPPLPPESGFLGVIPESLQISR